MFKAVHGDFETKSTVDLKKAGVYRYAESPHTGIWMLSWRPDDGAVNRWHPETEEPPLELIAHIEAGGLFIAQNAGFERQMWNTVLRRMYPWLPELKIDQQDCTMARAQALALPAGLDNLAIALKLRFQKDKEGYNLMLRMCRPRSMADDGTPIWWEEPDKIQRLGEYCDVDVLTECDADAALPQLNLFEKQIWRLDQTINDRGVLLDVHSIERALEVVGEANKRADDRMWYLTDGDVQKCTETAKIVAWLNKRGVPATSIAKGEHEEIILCGQIFGDDTVEEVIRLRGAASKTSTKKYKAMLDCVCADGRARGLFGYSVASTRRWAGRLIQPHNLPRIQDEDPPDVDRAIFFLNTPKTKADLLDSIELSTGRPALEVLSRSLRGMFMASAGKKFYGADFSNIEGVCNAWLAGEDWKLEGFRLAFAKMGPGMYETSYARSFGKSVADVTKGERQIGKVQELSLGYQGSVGAYVTMGANYGIKPGKVAEVARAATSDEAWEAVQKKYNTRDSRGLDRDTWTGIKIVVNSWRAAHPAIVGSWWALQEAALEAVQNPGAKIPVYSGKCAYLAANGFLFCQLPSKGVIAYAAPRIREVEWDPPVFYTMLGEETVNVRQVGDDPDHVMIYSVASGREIQPDEPLFLEDGTEVPMKVRNRKGRKKYVVEYDGVDSKTKRWSAQYLYGGLQCENIVQATARDFLAEAMVRIEPKYPIVLHVHDEVVSEVPEGFGSVDEYRQIMAQLPAWAEGCPIAVAAWEDKRYVK